MTGKRYMAVLLTVCMVLTACDSHGDKQTEASGTPHVEHHDKERQQLKKDVLKWANKQGEQHKRAVTNRYFGSGEISTGDWYALTADGQLQVSNQNKPGPKAFKLHTLTGFVTYKSAHKQPGIDSRAQNLSNVEGYANVADMSYPITKYLIADNGKVYKYQFQKQDDTRLSSGFAPKDHNDKDPNLSPNIQFKEVNNATMKQLLKQLKHKYPQLFRES